MYIDDKKAVVFVQKDEYEKMKELANANAEEIEKRALEMWETKAIPWLKVSMEIRSSGGRDILDSEYRFIRFPDDHRESIGSSKPRYRRSVAI